MILFCFRFFPHHCSSASAEGGLRTSAALGGAIIEKPGIPKGISSPWACFLWLLSFHAKESVTNVKHVMLVTLSNRQLT